MASSGAMTPPPDGDANSGSWLLALFWVEASLASIFVALRFYIRFALRIIGADDWTMLIAHVLFICTMAMCTLMVHYGFGRHAFYLDQDQLTQFSKWYWISQPFGAMVLPFAKVSISLLLLRLMGPTRTWQKWVLWVNMTVIMLIFVLTSIFVFVQCNPTYALWEPVPGAVCWNPEILGEYATFGSAYSAFDDFLLAIIPVTIFWNLQMSFTKKLSLCALLSVGIFSGICAAIKTAQSQDLAIRLDVTWGSVPLYAWSTSEVFLNVVCGCIPTLKPLYDFLINGQPLRPNSGFRSFQSGKSRSVTGSNSQKGLVRSTAESYEGSSDVNAHGEDGGIVMERSFAVEVTR